jgi:hypothetical protein
MSKYVVEKYADTMGVIRNRLRKRTIFGYRTKYIQSDQQDDNKFYMHVEWLIGSWAYQKLKFKNKVK